MKRTSLLTLIYTFAAVCLLAFVASAQTPKTDDKAEAVLQKAVARLGGDKYLTVKTLVGRGNFTQLGENAKGVPSNFVDYIVYPDRERTEFKSFGDRTIQVNTGATGWIFDSAARSINDQTPEQIANFKQSIRTSLDNLLRGGWRAEKGARLEYIGRREATLGKRNEVVKLNFADDFAVEFEFDAKEGTPMKSSYKRKLPEGETITEEDRFAQFVEVSGIFAPYIVDHFINGKQSSRINYSSIEFNTSVADTLFVKPINPKKVK